MAQRVAIDPAGLVTGQFFGDVYPPEAPPRGLPDKDAREHALEVFRRFVSFLAFERTGDRQGAPTIRFRVPLKNIHIYQPDDVKGLRMPGIGFLPGRGTHEEYGLGPPVVLEDTRDVFGHGTVLVRQSDYVEQFVFEVHGAKHAERRAIVAGMKEVLRMVDGTSSFRLNVKNYFDRVAEFSLLESAYIEDGAVLNRRRAHLFIELRIDEVFLVRYRELDVRVEKEVIDGQIEALLELLDE